MALNSAIYSESHYFFALNRIIVLANQNENEVILSITFHGLTALANQIAEKYKAKKVIWAGEILQFRLYLGVRICESHG